MADTLKRFASRAKQYAEEKVGHADKTDLDPGFEHLMARAEATKALTEKILKSAETYLEPNPTRRLELAALSMVRRKPKERSNETMALGKCMIDAGEDLFADSGYGVALIKAGRVEQSIGEHWSQMQITANDEFLAPLRQFLQVDMKDAVAQKKRLGTLRLDLDAAKSRVKKAAPEKLDAAEAQLAEAQQLFDAQAEVVQEKFEGILRITDSQVAQLTAFIEAQHTFFAQAAEITAGLGAELNLQATEGQGTSALFGRPSGAAKPQPSRPPPPSSEVTGSGADRPSRPPPPGGSQPSQAPEAAASEPEAASSEQVAPAAGETPAQGDDDFQDAPESASS